MLCLHEVLRLHEILCLHEVRDRGARPLLDRRDLEIGIVHVNINNKDQK
jgi:hypothetical protein